MTRSLWMLVPPLLAVGSILTLLNAVTPGPLASPRSQDVLNALFRRCTPQPALVADPTPSGIGCDVSASGTEWRQEAATLVSAR